ncbi:HdeD family acid-resistance protein [Natrinema gelatinilyticum]|uniref:HdeD family acid-resistance protein n=1 Tax=Natrinema gelatinilyticum TaxID=2961571 RepID=UPI0020C2EA0B|nr:HdeD family acid-resistance protein [Natrinema gelatinilyticum]
MADTSVEHSTGIDPDQDWRIPAGGGVLLVVLGLLAILFPFVTGVSLSVLLGALLVVGGFAHVAHAFSVPGWTGSAVQLLLAVIYVVAGIGLLANPVLGLSTLTLLVIAYLLVAGIVEIVAGLSMPSGANGLWMAVSGVIGILLAGLLWAGWPSTALWAIGTLFGINLLISGVALLSVGSAERRIVRGESATAA